MTDAVSRRRPVMFLVFVLALSLPFWRFGGGSLGLPITLPVGALQVVCPATAAVLLIGWTEGRDGLARLGWRVVDFSRVRWWFGPVLFIGPLVAFATYWVLRVSGRPLPAPDIGLIPVLLGVFLIGALGEEIGWSGYLTDPLTRRFGTVGGSVLIGAIWAAWQIPVWHWQTGQVLLMIAFRVIIVWLYKRTGRSIGVAVLCNTTISVSAFLVPFDPVVASVIAIMVIVFGRSRWHAGSGSPRRLSGGDVAAQVVPFRSETTPEQLADLRERLARTRFAPALSGTEWTHGTPPGYLAELLEYWRTEFDWPAAEQRLNAMPQFTADVDGQTVHFVHAKGVGPRPFPLLFTHGWPGSFWEVHKIIGPLTDPAAHGGDPADAFDLIAPSLPGYGFSPHPGTPGITPAAIATTFNKLMVDVLGYPRYGAQGGDWGAAVTSSLGREHGDTVAAIHLNLMLGALAPDLLTSELNPAEQAYVDGVRKWREESGGYGHIQGTRPSTLAAGLSDSPAGLAAWIVEKFRAWSDCDGDVESVFSKDELLTNITLYWLTNSIGTSARLYYESMHSDAFNATYVQTPTGYASFAKEIGTPPREWVARGYNLTRFTEFDRGGHFAALERPDELVTEIREFFRPFRD